MTTPLEWQILPPEHPASQVAARLGVPLAAQSAPRAVGNLGLLEASPAGKLALICSHHAPPGILLRLQDLAHQWRERGGPVIVSGFHSPGEQEAWLVLGRGGPACIWLLARGPLQRLPDQAQSMLAGGRLLVLTPFAVSARRVTAEMAAQRNRLACALSERVLIAFAGEGSRTEGLAEEVRGWGKMVVDVNKDDWLGGQDADN